MSQERLQDRETQPQKVNKFTLQCVYKDDIPAKIRLRKINADDVQEAAFGTLEEDIIIGERIFVDSNGLATKIPVTESEITRMLKSHFASSSVKHIYMIQGGTQILIVTESGSHYLMTNPNNELFRLRVDSFLQEESLTPSEEITIGYVRARILRKASQAIPSLQTELPHQPS